MNLKTLLTTMIITLVPTFSFAMGCAVSTGQQQVMSCAEGTQMDHDTGTCVPVVNS